MVDAASRKDAIVRLDEVGNAEEGDLFPLRNFLVNFKLRKEVEDWTEQLPVELESFGEKTEEFLNTTVYPVYSETLFEIDKNLPDGEVSDQQDQETRSKVTNAIETERNRRSEAREPELSENRVIRFCQEITGAPKVLAEQWYKEAQINM